MYGTGWRADDRQGNEAGAGNCSGFPEYQTSELRDAMLNGFYAIYYTGATGQGIGVLVITNTGIITGADMIGGRYDGNYTQNATGTYDAKMRMTFPPGTALVTGALAGPQPMNIDMTATLPANLGDEQPIRLQTPTGPINVIFRKLRDL